VPHHWRPIKEKGGGDARREEVTQVASDFGGELVFADSDLDDRKWYALVDVTNVNDPEEMWKKIGTNGPPTKFP
jgi:hypothetical protein